MSTKGSGKQRRGAGKEERQFGSFVEELFKAWKKSKKSEAESESERKSESESENKSESNSESESELEGKSESEVEDERASESESDSKKKSEREDDSESEGDSEAEANEGDRSDDPKEEEDEEEEEEAVTRSTVPARSEKHARTPKTKTRPQPQPQPPATPRRRNLLALWQETRDTFAGKFLRCSRCLEGINVNKDGWVDIGRRGSQNLQEWWMQHRCWKEVAPKTKDSNALDVALHETFRQLVAEDCSDAEEQPEPAAKPAVVPLNGKRKGAPQKPQPTLAQAQADDEPQPKRARSKATSPSSAAAAAPAVAELAPAATTPVQRGWAVMAQVSREVVTTGTPATTAVQRLPDDQLLAALEAVGALTSALAAALAHRRGQA